MLPKVERTWLPVQHARKIESKVRLLLYEAYRAVSEYRKKLPGKRRLLTMRRIIRIWLGLSSWQVGLARLFQLLMKVFFN